MGCQSNRINTDTPVRQQKWWALTIYFQSYLRRERCVNIVDVRKMFLLSFPIENSPFPYTSSSTPAILGICSVLLRDSAPPTCVTSPSPCRTMRQNRARSECVWVSERFIVFIYLTLLLNHTRERYFYMVMCKGFGKAVDE